MTEFYSIKRNPATSGGSKAPKAARLLVLAAALCVTASMAPGCSSSAKNDTFDLSASGAAAAPRSARNRQILIADPSALKALDSEQIVVRLGRSEIQYLSQAQWSDRLPQMVQAKLVQAFENSGAFGGVGKPGQGLAIDFQLVSEIRAFEIDASAGRATVEISAKLLNDRNGTVRAQKVFRSVVATGGAGTPAYISGLDRAFATVSAEIVSWTLTEVR